MTSLRANPAPPSIVFDGRAFAFTGGMLDLKRSAAEREVRSRGGLTTDQVNERLDYLVVGDKPSPAWKFGSYGRKIEAARALATGKRGRPRLVSENAFMEALAQVAPVNAGAIDEKVVVVNYKFCVPDGADAFDADAVEHLLRAIQEEYRCHVSVREHWALMADALFGDAVEDLATGDLTGLRVVTCRIVRQQRIDEAVNTFIDGVARGFEAIRGVDGRLSWFERVEGSADYIRLLREVPSTLRLAGL